MKIIGKIVKILHSSNNTNFHVFLVKTKTKYYKVAGIIINPELDIMYEFITREENDKYGLTYKIENYKLKYDTKESIVTFLSSDKFMGIGKKKAEKIVDVLGTNAIEEIKNNPTVLDKVKLSEKEKEVIITELTKNTENIEIIKELTTYGLSTKIINKIIEVYKENTLNTLRKNPYTLIEDIEGIGFKTADKIALKIGIKKNSKLRIKAAIRQTLYEETYKTGETKVESYKLIDTTYNLLEIEDLDLIKLNIDELILENKIIEENNYLTSSYFYNIEKNIAKNIERLNYKSKNKIKKIKEDNNIKYTEEQKNAIITALNNNLTLITGGPGTGKSTIIKGIIENLQEIYKDDLNLVLLAPTGKAAKRMMQTTNYKSSTIHKLLYQLQGDKILANVIIVDEISMLDIEIANLLLEQTTTSTKVILIGDKNQLPSVGVGALIEDLIISKYIPVVKLTKIMRQKEGSNIVELSQMVLNDNLDINIFKDNKETNFIKTNKEGFVKCLKKIIDRLLVLEGTLDNTQILIPYYKTDIGIDYINKVIQKEYNTNKTKSIKINDFIFYTNDRVIQTKNNKEKGIMNGDVGKIIDILDDEKVVVEFDTITVLEKDDLEDLQLAYAISVHKSQGSEYDNVIIAMFNAYFFLLNKRLIYTAITRAKQKCVIIGEYDALQRNISKTLNKRKTNLINFIEEIKKIDYPKIDNQIFDHIHENTNIKIDDFIDNNKTKI